jgi:hypothetical protein
LDRDYIYERAESILLKLLNTLTGKR